jgi:DNA modification methylase
VILYGDALQVLKGMDTASVQSVFTSPPYWEQRTYGGDHRELGHGSLQTYLDQLDLVLRELHRVLDLEGWMGWVVGDKAVGSGGAGGDHNLKGKHGRGSKHWIEKYGKAGAAPDYMRDGQFAMVPYRFADMAQRQGWLLRTMIVWDKSPMVKPEDPRHINRPMVSTERIVVLTKIVQARRWRHELIDPTGDRGDVWHVRTHRGAKAERHYAPFTGELPRRFILATTERGMTVLDPFVGSGTTVKIAAQLGRIGHGIELYPPSEVKP